MSCQYSTYIVTCSDGQAKERRNYLVSVVFRKLTRSDRESGSFESFPLSRISEVASQGLPDAVMRWQEVPYAAREPRTGVYPATQDISTMLAITWRDSLSSRKKDIPKYSTIRLVSAIVVFLFFIFVPSLSHLAYRSPFIFLLGLSVPSFFSGCSSPSCSSFRFFDPLNTPLACTLPSTGSTFTA